MKSDQKRRIESAINSALASEDGDYVFVGLSRADCRSILDGLKTDAKQPRSGRPSKSIRDQAAEKETQTVVRVLEMRRANPEMETKEIMTQLGLFRLRGASIEQQINTFEKMVRTRELAAVALMLGRRKPAAGKK
jgi:hypothetical protein